MKDFVVRVAGRDRAKRPLAAGIALAATASLVLAACGGESGNDGSSGAGVKPANLPTAGATVPDGTGTLDFVGFEGDDLPDILKDWFEAEGIKVNPNYQSGEPETLARLAGPAGEGADLASWTSGYSTQFAEAGVLQPLDPQKLPNLANIWPFFAEDDRGWFTNADGEFIGIPQYWGGIGLVWDTEVVSDMSAWDDILDPALEGKVAMIDFPESIYQAAALAVGDIDTAKMTKDDLTKLENWLRPVLKQVKVFSPSFGDIITLMGSHEVAAVFPGFPFLANAAAEAGADTFKATADIDGGAIGAIEILGIPQGADNADAAYAFLNQMLDPAVNAEISELQGSPGTVSNVVDEMTPEQLKAFPYSELGNYYEDLGLFTAVPRVSSDYVTQDELFESWAKLKASAK